jgi:hypothetical protein
VCACTTNCAMCVTKLTAGADKVGRRSLIATGLMADCLPTISYHPRISCTRQSPCSRQERNRGAGHTCAVTAVSHQGSDTLSLPHTCAVTHSLTQYTRTVAEPLES